MYYMIRAMPKRQSYIFCDCWLCVERNPENKGASHPSDAIFAHRRLASRMLEERNLKNVPTRNPATLEHTPSDICVDELAAALFGATISDEGPSNPHINRLWSSRQDYQGSSEAAFPQVDKLDLDDILCAIERMNLASLPDPVPASLDEVFGGLSLYFPSDTKDDGASLPLSPLELESQDKPIGFIDAAPANLDGTWSLPPSPRNLISAQQPPLINSQNEHDHSIAPVTTAMNNFKPLPLLSHDFISVSQPLLADSQNEHGQPIASETTSYSKLSVSEKKAIRSVYTVRSLTTLNHIYERCLVLNHLLNEDEE